MAARGGGQWQHEEEGSARRGSCATGRDPLLKRGGGTDKQVEQWISRAANAASLREDHALSRSFLMLLALSKSARWFVAGLVLRESGLRERCLVRRTRRPRPSRSGQLPEGHRTPQAYSCTSDG